VPLNAVIQSRAPVESRARVLAASALMNAVFAVAATALSALLLLAGVGIPGLFFALGLAGLAVAVVACALLPAQLVKSLAQALFKALYRVRVEGTEHLATAGPRAVIVANHVSYLDAALLAAFLPGRPVFAINAEVARRWWVAPWGRIVRFFPMEPGNPYALKALIREVEAGAHCVIFPEGRLTETGALMKIYEGPGLVADRADAPIVPVRLQGVQYTPLATRLAGRVPRRWLPRITLTVLPPRPIGIGADLRGRARRAAAGLALYDLMEGMMCATWPRPRPATLWGALIAARALHGAGAPIVQDATRAPVTYGALLRRAVALAGALQGVLPAPEGTRTQDAKPKAPPAVGLLMPTGVAGLVAFFALQALARPAAMLNFSAGPGPALDACRAARASTVLTARAFIERARLAPLVEALEGAGLAVLYLEDIAGRIGPLARLRAALTPARALPGAKAAQPDDVAAILFTSGSEGAPKGVALTHANILANIAQLSCRVDFTPADVVLCALPAFHAFGLTGGVLLPVLSGVRTVLYPSPLHYRIVPEVAYATNATVMFGTDTFLAGYAAKANPYDFYRMRYIFAGAERLRESTRRVYADRFGVRVLEGYGATEAAPVVAVNGPMHNRPGTVGRLLPGIAWRLEPVEGVAAPPGARAGRLLIRGANVMAGYLRAGAPGVLEPPAGGWYDTGDIVAVDAQGYVAITGRAKRFAKVGGEMVSLAAVERLAAAASPGGAHAAVAADDARKGQKVVLVTTDRALKRPALTRAAADAGASALAVPARIVFCEALPLLPTGKVDYAAVAGVAG
jgi:acyl-[acyl-carrier-protein]-phospholipid O-acyltransferase / long-chain-fatty-acid--[acyl-carrier-protein] ligase